MKKKTILWVLFVVFIFMLTSSSYGGIDPRYKDRVREHPEQELLFPANGDEYDDVLLLIIPGSNGFSFLFYSKGNSSQESLHCSRLAPQEFKYKTNNVKKEK